MLPKTQVFENMIPMMSISIPKIKICEFITKDKKFRWACLFNLPVYCIIYITYVCCYDITKLWYEDGVRELQLQQLDYTLWNKCSKQ